MTMVRKSFFIRVDQLGFLQNLPEKDSVHIRRAIDDYIEKLKKSAMNVSPSLSTPKKNFYVVGSPTEGIK